LRLHVIGSALYNTALDATLIREGLIDPIVRANAVRDNKPKQT
jgi:hypothetical protein